MADVFDQLEHDHRAVERMLAQYHEDGDDALAHEIGVQLSVHTEIEELVVYPVLRDLPGGAELAEQAELEHGAVTTALARMWDSPPDDLRELVRTVGEQVRAHVQEEESRIFPLMRQQGVDADRLGRDLEEARDGARHRIERSRA